MWLLLLQVILSFCLSPALCQTGCVVLPEENIQNISAACPRDIKSCSTSPCTGCSNHGSTCCQGIYDIVQTSCPAGDVPYSTIRRCSCLPCAAPSVSISGSIVGDCEVATCDLLVTFNGGTTRATADGAFDFSTDFPDDGRVLFSVSDDVGNIYFTRQKVVNVVTGVTTYLDVEVYVIVKPSPISVNSSEGEAVDLASGDITLTFAPDSFTNEDGTPYNGLVDVVINFIDPTSDEPSAIPLQLVTPDGAFLSSAGMIQLEITDPAGNPLVANDVEIELATGGLTSDEIDGMGLWQINPVTGYWELLSDFDLVGTTGPGRRKKRGISVLIVTVTVRWLTYLNLDIPLRDICYMKVRLFPPISITVTSVFLRLTNNAWASYRTNYAGPEGACIDFPCNRGGHDIHRILIAAPGYQAGTPSMSSTLQANYSYADTLDGFQIDIPIDGALIGSNGPVYNTRGECNNAPASDNYFVLTGPDLDEESNLIPMDEDDLSSLSSSVFAWWPNPSDEIFTACYIKVAVSVASGSEVDVKVVSNAGDHSVTQGFSYGYRISTTSFGQACVEYKCANTLSDGEFDRTVLEVIPLTNETILLSDVAMYNVPDESSTAMLQLGNDTYNGPAPINPSLSSGVYSVTSSTPILAKYLSKLLCILGSDVALTFTNPFVGSGSGSGSGNSTVSGGGASGGSGGLSGSGGSGSGGGLSSL